MRALSTTVLTGLFTSGLALPASAATGASVTGASVLGGVLLAGLVGLAMLRTGTARERRVPVRVRSRR